ncbi:alpha/beta fold hydrolase [Chitinophaga sp. SYP-B3965]|uniref:alpha/beta fold hydrolase n=1 Tax=Chitinophaga sp. SYP-B3965 TaxID=2663120 RepID=UPI0012998970|nr:alpha/beta hydrolase [Chitinophaga sp. SYP-B3965]MRG44112.1 alpha/beta fold hydrolase [Chitinophaga sp. SYP-B3965]
MRYCLLLFIFSTNMALGQAGSVTVEGKKMGYTSYGLETRKPNTPVLVFEAGLGSGGGSYELLFPALSQKTAGIAYDRNGLGGSEPDTTIKSDGDVARRLHALLKELKVQPPYLLVGHSLGGPFIRLFTALYPNEVAGLLFIDPTDFMLTEKEDEQIKTISNSAMGYRKLIATMFKRDSEDTTNSIGTRNEMKRLRKIGYFEEYTSLAPLPDIPVTVLMSYNRYIEKQEEELGKELKINMMPWFAEMNRLRIDHFADMIKNNHNSSVILLPRYSHGIHHQDPALASTVILDLYNRILAQKK